MSRTIEITVSSNGEIQVETRGFSGSECQEASKSIEEALGRRSGERLTIEFYQTVQKTQSERTRNG